MRIRAWKRRDFVDFVVCVCIVIAGLVAGLFGYFVSTGHLAAFTSTIVIFLLTPLYLIARRPENLRPALYAGVTFGLLLGLPFDFTATAAHAWMINGSYVYFPH